MGAIEEAVELKEKGNKAFKEHDWDSAISFYTQAIEKNGQEPSFYTNRAQVSINGKHASNSHSCRKELY
jgi:serine/threonine-protein phosphatase 5